MVITYYVPFLDSMRPRGMNINKQFSTIEERERWAHEQGGGQHWGGGHSHWMLWSANVSLRWTMKVCQMDKRVQEETAGGKKDECEYRALW